MARSIEDYSGISARMNSFKFTETKVMYDTSDIDRHWSSDTVRHWCSAAKDTSNAVRHWSLDARGHHRTGTTSNPRCGVRNNKALIKAGNLKGLLEYPTYKLFGFTLRSSRLEMGRFVKPVFKTDDRRRRKFQKNRGASPTSRPVQGATNGVLE